MTRDEILQRLRGDHAIIRCRVTLNKQAVLAELHAGAKWLREQIERSRGDQVSSRWNRARFN